MRRLLLVLLAALAVAASGLGQRPARAELYGYSGFATYYGIEDGFVRGDIMFDGTPYDPADPTITAASFLIPLHTRLLVCIPSNCIEVEVRDRGLLDQNGILLDLSRAAYAKLFGGLGGKQWVSAYYIDALPVALQASVQSQVAPGGSLAPPSGLPEVATGSPPAAALPATPAPTATPTPDKMHW